MSRSRSIAWTALLAAAVLTVTGPAPAGAADVIKFGVSTPLSGPAAPWGIPHKAAVELVFDEINSQGGLEVGGKKYKLEVVAYDHKYVIAEGVATINRLIAKDGVKYISILGGSVVKATEEAMNEAGVMNLPLAYAEGLVSPKNPLTFHSFPSPPETTTFWKWIKEHHPQIKRVASITPNDDTGWWSLKVETRFVAKLGYEVVAREFFERGVTDFNPILLRILAQKPDIISALASPAGSVGLIVKQARELGFKGRFIHLGQLDTSVVANIAGKANAEGMWVHGYVQAPLPEKVRNWQARYTKKFGEWNASSIDFNNPAFAFVAAVRKAQSLDPKKVAEAMSTVTFDNLWGKAYFGGKEYYGIGNQIIYPMPFSEVKDGVATLVVQLPPPHK
ncbi:MAG: ABC transporter substrate-binding protein [candidate division NC10 bacterium]|nr:ABC transporter substrate-binding protein [candidate division NC10 bacterium]